MEEKKFVEFKKNELAIKEYVQESLGKGIISSVRVEYTPVGERIVVRTHKPGIVIGRRGEKINKLTETLKKKFKLENPYVEIEEISEPDLDARIVAERLAMALERFGTIRFKAFAYRALERIMKAGALGAEIRLSGKLPSERARTWRFASGYLKKTGEDRKKVDYAQTTAKTPAGVVGVKVSILRPDVFLPDRITVDDNMLEKIKENAEKLKAETKQDR